MSTRHSPIVSPLYSMRLLSWNVPRLTPRFRATCLQISATKCVRVVQSDTQRNQSSRLPHAHDTHAQHSPALATRAPHTRHTRTQQHERPLVRNTNRSAERARTTPRCHQSAQHRTAIAALASAAVGAAPQLGRENTLRRSSHRSRRSPLSLAASSTCPRACASRSAQTPLEAQRWPRAIAIWTLQTVHLGEKC